MSESATLRPKMREDLIRKAWYSHDARWFNAVSEEFGMEAANRVNRKAVRAMAAVEAKRLHTALGLPPVRSVAEFLAFTEAGQDLYVAWPLIEMSVEQVDVETYDAVVSKCFVAENIARAGIADSYECAVFERVAGWHDGLGLPLEGQLPAQQCVMAAGRECRQRLRIA